MGTTRKGAQVSLLLNMPSFIVTTTFHVTRKSLPLNETGAALGRSNKKGIVSPKECLPSFIFETVLDFEPTRPSTEHTHCTEKCA
jgi:hypothetical protein